MSRTRLILLLLVLGTLAVYLPVMHHDFCTFDDGDYVNGNSMVYHGLTLAGIKWAFTSYYASNWHPLTWMSHMLDCQLFGVNPGPQHVVNVLFHVANTILLFVLLSRWISLWPSALVAALFAWHPMHVESVAWISERKDVLSTFFALLCLLCYARYVTEGGGRKAEGGRRKSGFWYLISVFCFTAALLSKPMFVTLPCVMLLLDLWPLQRFNASTLQRLLVEKAPFFLLSVASCVVTFVAQHRGGLVMSFDRVPMGMRLVHVPVNYALYLSKLLWPSDLAIFYPLAPVSTLSLIVAVVVLIAVSAAAWRARGPYPYLLFGWLWFLGTLVPVIGLVQVGGAAMADRYTYFPSIGLFLALVLGLAECVRRFHLSRALTVVPSVLALAVLLWLTHVQVNYWRNDVALFSHALATTKDNVVLRLCLGLAYERNEQIPQAVAQYAMAVKLEPGRARTHSALANALARSEQPAAGLPEFEEALRLDPNNVSTHNNLGMLYVRLDRLDDAMAEYSKSLELAPHNWRTPFLMAQVAMRRGQDQEATALLQRALQEDPNNPFVLDLLGSLQTKGPTPKKRDSNQ